LILFLAPARYFAFLRPAAFLVLPGAPCTL
jgi:hypothetical protein